MKFAATLLSVIGVAQANWKSGSVSTYEKFTYGKFVTRMKAPDKKGTVSSFFTYWDGPGFYPGGWNELDVEIVPSVEQNPFSMNIIYGDGHNKLESHDYAQNFNPGSDWHEYVMEWTPDYISWSIDGHEVRHVPSSDPAVQYMNKAQSLRMNFWTPTFHSWGEGFDPADMPWYVLYDYVEVFTYNDHTNEFDFHWRDDFNAFDSGRWHKASGGFEANSSVFYPSNVYTSSGNLVLKMEPLDGQPHLHSHSDSHDTHFDLHLHGSSHLGEAYHPHDLHAYEPSAHISDHHSLLVDQIHDQWEHQELYHAHDAAHDLHHDKHDVDKHDIHIPRHETPTLHHKQYYQHGQRMSREDAIDEKVIEQVERDALDQVSKSDTKSKPSKGKPAILHGHSDEHASKKSKKSDSQSKSESSSKSAPSASSKEAKASSAKSDSKSAPVDSPHHAAAHSAHAAAHAIHSDHYADAELGRDWETHHHRRTHAALGHPHATYHGHGHIDTHAYSTDEDSDYSEHSSEWSSDYDDDYYVRHGHHLPVVQEHEAPTHHGHAKPVHHKVARHRVHHTGPVVVHPPHESHHDLDFTIHHETHPELDHAYDHPHDVEPLEWEDHSVHHKVDPESYLERTWAVDKETHIPHGHWSEPKTTVHHTPVHHSTVHHVPAHHEIVHEVVHHAPVHHAPVTYTHTYHGADAHHGEVAVETHEPFPYHDAYYHPDTDTHAHEAVWAEHGVDYSHELPMDVRTHGHGFYGDYHHDYTHSAGHYAPLHESVTDVVDDMTPFEAAHQWEPSYHHYDTHGEFVRHPALDHKYDLPEHPIHHVYDNADIEYEQAHDLHHSSLHEHSYTPRGVEYVHHGDYHGHGHGHGHGHVTPAHYAADTPHTDASAGHSVIHHTEAYVTHPYHEIHHDVEYHIAHRDHPELDHAYDHKADITPHPWHEHSVLPAVDIPDHHSYHPEDFHPVEHSIIEYEPEYDSAHRYHHIVEHQIEPLHGHYSPHHETVVTEVPFSHGHHVDHDDYKRFYVEEPIAETAHDTWHGRHVDFTDKATLAHYAPVHTGYHLGEGHSTYHTRHPVDHDDHYQVDYDIHHAGEHVGEHLYAHGTHREEPVTYLDEEKTPFEVKHAGHTEEYHVVPHYQTIHETVAHHHDTDHGYYGGEHEVYVAPIHDLEGHEYFDQVHHGDLFLN